MTTLRTFQNEIEDIHNREISKQRALALADKEKEQKNPKGKAKEEANHTSGPSLTGTNVNKAAGFQEMEERILVRQHVMLRQRHCSYSSYNLDFTSVFKSRRL